MSCLWWCFGFGLPWLPLVLLHGILLETKPAMYGDVDRTVDAGTGVTDSVNTTDGHVLLRRWCSTASELSAERPESSILDSV